MRPVGLGADLVLIFMIRVVNGVTDFWSAYWQSLLFLEVMNCYDGLVIDELWVRYDSFWFIEEMKDLTYVQSLKDMLRKRTILALAWIALSFVCALIIVLL